MKKIFTSFFFLSLLGTANAQWSPAAFKGEKVREGAEMTSHYTLDLTMLRAQLANAPEMGNNAKPVEISLPTLGGKVEKFAVYSFPVVVKELADQYQLGSYVGVGIDDPSKYLRFSTSPIDFQSMIIKDGVYQFIDPADNSKTIYSVHPKTIDTGSQGFLCSMNEDVLSKEQIAKLFNSTKSKSFSNNPTDFSKSSDKKYRTMRLALSVTGEYTTYFGGVSGALVAMNNTMTRVNGVFEKDLAIHLNMQNFPVLVYADPNNDPYSPASSMGNWNVELQANLTNTIGSSSYDIGHLFGRSGGGGNAGCIGCVCVDPVSPTSKAKGSGYTSPANAIPQGDSFDIDYVAHEMGHQLGANHTFSHNVEGSGVNMEPGSGSTIMGYAGITSANVQLNSDPYFHVASIIQIQNNMTSKTCDVETAVANNPPVISALNNYMIPKGTAFVLTGNATDPEGNPMTYTWEQFDTALTAVTAINGNNTLGPLFRSILPTTSPTRYFPKLATVLAGNLSSTADWEATPLKPRSANFVLTVRDNNPNVFQQQTNSALQHIDVGNEGPFKVTSTTVYNNTPGAITWDVVGTNGGSYNTQNVKIDYTTDNGVNWTVITPSTPNDGAEPYSFSSLSAGTNVKIRVSAIGNVFYAIGSATVSATPGACSAAAATGVAVTGITMTSVNVTWTALQGATYSLRYRKTGAATWTTVSVPTNSYQLTGLEEGTSYEVQVANVCGSTLGAYSASVNFNTLLYAFCTNSAGSAADEYISNVSVTPTGSAAISNPSGASTYTNYTTDLSKLITLTQGSTNNSISVTKAWTSSLYAEGVTAWIDFNRDGNFSDTEMIFTSSPNTTTPVSGTFSVPATAYAGGKNVIMRVMLTYGAQADNGCEVYPYGEIEDYPVLIQQVLGTNDIIKNNDGIQIYPNPATDVLNVTKVSDKASYKIYGTTGQLVGSGNVNSGKINVSALVKGGYIITIEEKGKDVFTSKFIKK
ncbi:reprolysin-like metallopeptidase [Chryseobacterium daecheongense]|uniref:Secreted protein (Por secretion system target) n=1 Tax=Chryseobacterium daecheongense TaxID=192389 RepID=A0A3N0VW36_9FLAO|nr:zinc-dependent metalloprotease family protein [Chryseobacterium daecheongense]ROH96710.1 T9SS C-terminal target domain-containing protein [Chryseobacterium daecheongense]TDX90717.1 putative secreted protein (Por secretion system target) [Chryseobacterium daecheongense]